MPSKLFAAIAAASAVSPFLGMVPVVGQALPLALSIIKQYRQTRDAIEMLHPDTSGLLSDLELFDLLQKESDALVEHADELIAKWSR